MLRDKNRIDDLLMAVFTEDPTSNLDVFLTSALLDLRRVMADDSLLIKQSALIEMSSRLPNALLSNLYLPPWEGALLSDLLRHRPVILVQGGSGSGKTSALHYLRAYCHQVIEEKFRARASNFPHLLLTIDLQDQDDRFTRRLESEELRQTQEH